MRRGCGNRAPVDADGPLQFGQHGGEVGLRPTMADLQQQHAADVGDDAVEFDLPLRVRLLIGLQRMRAYNAIDLTTRILAVLLVASTALLGMVRPELVFALIQATVVLSVVWCYVRLREQFATPASPSRETLRGGLGYGIKAYLGSLFAFLVLKSDVLLVSYLRGPVETGYYSIAVGLADILLMLPAVIGTVLAIAHMNASNSRAVAVTMTLWCLPRAARRRNRLHSRTCAFHPMSWRDFGRDSTRR